MVRGADVSCGRLHSMDRLHSLPALCEQHLISFKQPALHKQYLISFRQLALHKQQLIPFKQPALYK
eukprot:78833-Pelagomonas_calceolata.AAC.1